MNITGLITTALRGASSGAASALATTPEGQRIIGEEVKARALQWLPLAALGGIVLGLVFTTLRKRR